MSGEIIYLSTGGASNQTAYGYAKQLFDAGAQYIELSGGQYDPDMLPKLKTLRPDAHLRLHNYFPPPEKPFVFNLASQDEEVVERSLDHAFTAIRWSAELESPVYSFHAGFLIDPRVEELGRRVTNRAMMDRRIAKDVFTENVIKLADFAKKNGVDLLVENNVISSRNHSEFNGNPFLLTSADETINVMSMMPDNVNLLVDVAHLKVSANTLSFDPVTYLEDCRRWIRAYHLSDNDGTSDSNEEVGPDSWFWPHLTRGLNYYSLEVYRRDISSLMDQISLCKAKFKPT